jgi:hypothetical protein
VGNIAVAAPLSEASSPCGVASLTIASEVLIHRTLPVWQPAFRFTYAKPCTILEFLSRAALQPDDFENPTMSPEVSDVEERRSQAAGNAAADCR